MGTVHSLVMLATLGGFLALLLGLLLLLLPLLVSELSRPRDSAWGAVVLLLGLVLVTSAERLTGAPMLAVLCGGLLVGRLGGEVAQGRWRALTEEERRALLSSDRWSRSLHQLGAIVASLLQSAAASVATLAVWLGERRQGRSHGKRWVRTESDAEASAEVPGVLSGAEAEDAAPAPSPGSSGGDELPAPPSSPESSPAVERSASAEARAVSSPAGEVLPAAPISEEAAAGARPPVQEGDDRAEKSPSQASPETAAPLAGASAPDPDPGLRVVADFNAVDALLAAAPEPSDAAAAGSLPAQGSGGEAG